MRVFMELGDWCAFLEIRLRKLIIRREREKKKKKRSPFQLIVLSNSIEVLHYFLISVECFACESVV